MGVEMTSSITVRFSFLTQLFPVPGPGRYVFQPWGYPIGLELARLADLPEEAMEHARGVAEKLTNLDKAKQAASKTTQATARRKAVLRVRLHNQWLGDLHAFVDEEYLWSQLRTQLTQAYEYSALPDHELSLYLARLQKEIVALLGSVLDE
jgi:DNA mismatch repair protein MSH4